VGAGAAIGASHRKIFLVMERITSNPRNNWQSKVEEVGLTYHTLEGRNYWDESVYYRFSLREVETIEKAANDLHEMCLAAAQKVIDENRFEQIGIPPIAREFVVNSWERDDFSLYGRFDFVFCEDGQIKMLEYNADTPTALVEAAVAQWYWLQEMHPKADQFNSIHEHLIQGWKKYKGRTELVHLGGVKGHLEDEQTVLYLQDTCHQAGLRQKHLFMEDAGFDQARRRFVDLDNMVVTDYFKLYPWEWLWDSEFSNQLQLELVNFIEPTWKMLLSSKGLLPILWEMFPRHPNLLPAYFSAEEYKAAQGGWTDHVIKPRLSREGANITLVQNGVKTQTLGEYGEEGFIWQKLAATKSFDGNYPTLGVWVVNHEACGLGIREDVSRITGNLSRFVPHLF
jgi:glutathionylspermidine synthase